ncbi:MAG: TIGR03619 family F420-dependent LLM class oxidoreductase [Caldilineaceae bacterium]|nr:TIGR03619 family F420-dependent LLM class oxidoreductase [Caldilineaceae bacterium]
MRFGIEVVTLGELADPRRVVQLAEAAEAAGWEALVVWDHLGFVWGAPSGDPWIILAAVAQATTHLRLATGVTPLARHQPQMLAHMLAALDRLSEGRVILGVGLGGVAEEFSAFGGPGDARVRAAMVDEGLDLLDRFWRGDPVTHQGEYYQVTGVTLAPLPLQQPRIPIWIGGESAQALRRAARWDGWIINGVNEANEFVRSPAQMAEKIAYIRQHRSTGARFEIAMTGLTQPGETDVIQPYREAGVTWWFETLHGYRGDFDALLARVDAGPPHLNSSL